MTDAPDDRQARRDTPLALKLQARIHRDGPITVGDYMRACLHDAEHGYYVRQPAIGSAADFITAPEISQIFGELIGLWTAVTWQLMGEPRAFDLVEFGPGRGTLMRDALRAMRALPRALAAARVLLVESSAPLRAAQAATLGGLTTPIGWIDRLDAAATAGLPTIMLGNEFLDTAPIEQFVRTASGWTTHCVGLDAARRLVYTFGQMPSGATSARLDRHFPTATIGTIGELACVHRHVLGAMNMPSPRAALFIDYGHAQSGVGNTLQAVRNHAYEHPLTSPGEADLTAHVDFQQFVDALEAASLRVDGPTTQAEFLGSLGIMERASRLMAANPGKAAEIETGVARLMSPSGMGSRFKAIGLRSAHLPSLPGFRVVDKLAAPP